MSKSAIGYNHDIYKTEQLQINNLVTEFNSFILVVFDIF